MRGDTSSTPLDEAGVFEHGLVDGHDPVLSCARLVGIHDIPWGFLFPDLFSGCDVIAREVHELASLVCEVVKFLPIKAEELRRVLNVPLVLGEMLKLSGLRVEQVHVGVVGCDRFRQGDVSVILRDRRWVKSFIILIYNTGGINIFFFLVRVDARRARADRPARGLRLLGGGQVCRTEDGGFLCAGEGA